MRACVRAPVGAGKLESVCAYVLITNSFTHLLTVMKCVNVADHIYIVNYQNNNMTINSILLVYFIILHQHTCVRASVRP